VSCCSQFRFSGIKEAHSNKSTGNWGLKWQKYHRHVIESIGSGAAIGECGSRFLWTLSDAGWQREVLAVGNEMDQRKFGGLPNMKLGP
jgi:hypothetical protein